MDDREQISEALERTGVTRAVLAATLGVSVASIGRLVRCERKLEAGEKEKAFRLLKISGPPPLRAIPIIGQIAAGNWAEAVQRPIGQTWTAKGGAKAFALLVDGDSMDQIAAPGASVVIDPDDRDLIDMRSYAVMNDHGETTLKQFRSSPARLEPLSNNPTHGTIAIGREGFTVVGRAIEVTREL